MRFSVDDVMVMLREGVLPEDATTELLNGLIVLKDRGDHGINAGEDPRVQGPKHRLCVRLLTKLAAIIDTADRHVQIQLPLVCGDDQMPEPDLAVIRGADRDYASRLPSAADAFCVMEVADSSLERDVEEKLHIYARAGIEQYVVLNLRNRTAEVYTAPDIGSAGYAPAIVVPETGAVTLRVGPEDLFPIHLSDYLP